MPGVFRLDTDAPEQTEALGHRLGALLSHGAVVALRGELAAGKTCLVRGLASHFATGELVSSPTFTIVNQYGESPKLYHVDLYRLSGPAELADLGYEELFDPDGVCVIEWAERAGDLLPERRLEVLLEHGGGDCRKITIRDLDVLSEGWEGMLSA